jgi:predicted enzyme related to lactoylglutathione lyase
MPPRNEYPAGVPCWVDTSQPDPKAAADFYGGLFGWKLENVMPPDSDAEYFIAEINGGQAAGVGSIPEGLPEMAMWNTYVAVESADETASKVKEAGGSVLMEPFDIGDSGRMAVFADPEGAAICVWQAKDMIGATVVNEHGTVNFNDLNTRDVDGAKAFYGAVFGWTTLDLGGGVEMWTLPGYGDHLERDNPDMRKNMEEMGGPKGFEDVVANLNPIPDDQPDTPAHWGVTFAVDDADAAASKATELGGEVLAPPMDLPWVRMTVLRDPQGATFVASKFVPENKDLNPAESGAGAS